MNFQLSDQHCVNSRIKGISILAILMVATTTKGDETSMAPVQESTDEPLTNTDSVTVTNANMSTSTVGAASTMTSTTSTVIRSSVVHSTISYPIGEMIHNLEKSNFVVPHFHVQSRGKWGPFFEEGPEPHNVTARVGSTVTLDCRIGLLQDKTVTWLHHSNDSIHLLTVGKTAYSSDDRINLSFRYPNNWRLEILYVTRKDQGLYECQVATHPPKVKRVFLKVVAPELTVVDHLGRHVTERYYKVGSALELTCIYTHTEIESNNIDDHKMTWRHADTILKQGISLNYSQNSNAVISSVTISPVSKKHSGNYTCSIDNIASASVSVHILNDELPAAVHHDNSASTHRSENSRIFLTCIFPLVILAIDLGR